MERSAIDVHIQGFVQGVAYRYYTKARADSLGVTGWVRNERDGSVRGHFEGSRDAVDSLVAWCHKGPPLASVKSVDVTDGDDTGASKFEIAR
ncbi:acylphosphatase [Epidermidibacterium keratini]|uniref:acylphosphatase n=1 Tax=Epidermidibacterium keratini TaxID=1891644 RepID=A0A7L4YLF8_9ACTN|nr:acylphosphatase [Epidermidibacterium keratini]QHB99386.1 acylphosphatase [Epidermidibacterium keratini]